VRRILQALGMIIVGALFGLAIAAIEPHPYAHDVEIFAISSVLFVVVAMALRRPRAQLAWAVYGALTSICFLLISLWFWQGAMDRGWWYPPKPPILEQFLRLDGEAGLDAQVSDLFLVVWLPVTVALTVAYVMHARRRSPHPPHAV
jgi:hypothetical protein